MRRCDCTRRIGRRAEAKRIEAAEYSGRRFAAHPGELEMQRALLRRYFSGSIAAYRDMAKKEKRTDYQRCNYPVEQ
jgi:hypothetical protein